LGSQLYSTNVSVASAAELSADATIKYNSKFVPIPNFEGKENCTFTVRVPRYYLGSSADQSLDEDGNEEAARFRPERDLNYSFDEICRRREIWGTDIYTDDSDPIAAAVHAGWFQGAFGDLDEDIRHLRVGEGEDAAAGPSERNPKDAAAADPSSPPTLTITTPPPKPLPIPLGHDAHITLLILPPLAQYASTHRHHLLSRPWPSHHDGMSFAIHRIEFVREGPVARFAERGAKARKARLFAEEKGRREAAALGLLLFSSGGGGGRGAGNTANGGIVRVGA
jgi:hypothetical protein